MNQISKRERRLSGVPSGIARPWWGRMLRSPVFWLSVILLPMYALMLVHQWVMFSTAEEFEDGTETLAFTVQTLRQAALLALPTAVIYSTLFLWLDRFRPQRPMVWLLTFGWGAAASTWFSLHVNTWMGQHMATTAADADTGARSAVFSAPVIEEATKATVLFLLIILMRRQVVSRLSIIALSGLSAIGFAFVENIIYYGRAITYAVNDISVEDPEAAVRELVLLRGLYTSFGHPLFTTMTAVGLAVAIAARSKLVRVLAPIGGFFLAVAGHMLFNGLASTHPTEELFWHWVAALVVVGIIVIVLIVSVFLQARLIRRRLTDFAEQGWLKPGDIELFGRVFPRLKYLMKAVCWGPKRWWYSAHLTRAVTELAYLRSAQTRGQVGQGGAERIAELVQQIEDLRPLALSLDPNVRWFGWRKRRRRSLAGSAGRA